MILDSTYFHGELYLPNLEIKSSTVGVASMLQTVGEQNLNWFITKYEPEFLIKLLGKKLYENFKEGLKALTPLPIWTNLKNALYKNDGDFGFSPAANYVFYWTSRRGRTQTAIQGEVIGTSDYSVTAEDANKMVKVWNDMCAMVTEFKCGFLKDNWEQYKDYADRNCYSCEFQLINTWNI